MNIKIPGDKTQTHAEGLLARPRHRSSRSWWGDEQSLRFVALMSSWQFTDII